MVTPMTERSANRSPCQLPTAMRCAHRDANRIGKHALASGTSPLRIRIRIQSMTRRLAMDGFQFGGISTSERTAPRLTRCNRMVGKGGAPGPRPRRHSRGRTPSLMWKSGSGEGTNCDSPLKGGRPPFLLAFGSIRYRFDPMVTSAIVSKGLSVRSMIGIPIFAVHIDLKAVRDQQRLAGL
jgi:hypothetical protein